MKKLLIAVLCLMLTGCAVPAPSYGSGPDRSVSPDIPAPSPAASSAPNGESGPPQASPETDPETAENPSASQEPSESSLGPQNQEQIIQELLSAMTLEEKVGQMFFVRCPETGGAELAAQYKVGGYLLFGRDFKDKTAQQVRDDIQRLSGRLRHAPAHWDRRGGRHGGAGQQQSGPLSPAGHRGLPGH